MNPEQLDNALVELEVRLERLRSLYEQYFMGIERLEPTIPRKDVERRLFELRKTRFQNTAKRFKFQTITQRFNSLQQYWYRTCRDIEKGTYKRHLKKAERRFGIENAERFLASPAEEKRRTEQKEAQAGQKERQQQDLQSLDQGDLDLDAELENALAAVMAPAAQKEASPGNVGPGASTSENAAAGGLLTRLGKRSSNSPRISASPTISLQHSSRPPAPQKGSGLRTSQSPQPPPLRTMTSEAVAEPQRTSPRPPAAPSLRARAKQTPPQFSSQENSEPTTLARSPSPRPLPPARAQARPEPREGAARGRKTAGSLSDARVRDIFDKYSDARRKTDGAAVSYEKLSRSIRETEQKLRQMHKGRPVDFDVAIKAGKAILKPKLK